MMTCANLIFYQFLILLRRIYILNSRQMAENSVFSNETINIRIRLL
jgi:hypothetical protein